MKRPLRIGIVGCGQISKILHAPDIATCGKAEIVALCDASGERAEDIARAWAPKAAIFGDHQTMLHAARPDAVVVALPNRFHAQVSIAALKAGCHVLVEKPMAGRLAEAKRMMLAAKTAKRLLMVNHCDRLKPVHRKAREILASGMLGKPLLVSTMFGHEGPEHWSPKAKWFFRASEAKFGAMADLGIHKADLLRYLTGEEVAEVAAFTATLEKKGADVEDNCVAALRFASGALGTLTASWTTKGMFAEYTIVHCTKGTLRINEIPGKPLVANLSAAEGEWVIDVPPGVHRYEGSWDIDAGGQFVDAVLGDAPPYVTSEDGLKSLAIVLAAEKSARTGRSVKVGAA